MIKTRFAPSPTGFLHVGGLRTALFSYLFAKKNGGTFLLRVEDTDRERFVEGGIENILRSLAWAGIQPDEGVLMADGSIEQKGPHGPYVQSERRPIYKKYVQELLDKGHAYYAFDTVEELDAMRQMQQAQKLPSRYDRKTMKNEYTLGEEETKRRGATGVEYVIRLKMPENEIIVVPDAIRGEVKFNSGEVDDQVLMKSDGFPTYHLAVVVDDHLMEITHVIRGEEWLSSTPKHVQLYRAFGWDLPVFAHVPLMVNEKHQKLSKRHGDVSVEDFKEKGYLAEALVNFISFCGWNPGDERELFTLKDLEKEFDLSCVSKSAAVFNNEKLDWYNKQYMANMDLDDLARRAFPFFQNAGIFYRHSESRPSRDEESVGAEASHENRSFSRPVGLLQDDGSQGKHYDFDFFKKAINLERGRAATLVELAESTGFLFTDNLAYEPELLIWKKSTKEEIKINLNKLKEILEEIPEEEWSQEKLEARVKSWIEENNLSTGAVLWPMRVALSGQKNSPGPFEIAGVLRKDKTVKRLGEAIVALA